MSVYLLTGAAGFIGSRTAALLLEQGHKVVGVDNMNDYYDVRLKEYRLGMLNGREGFEFVQLDIERFDDLKALFSKHKFDAVVNLAARAGVRYSMENPFVYQSTNATGTLNLLECMRQSGVDKFVLASTSSLYAGQEMPFTETLPVNTPISPYAATKKAAEAMAYSYHHLYGIDVSVVRYFTVFGPCGRPDMCIFRFIEWVLNEKPIVLFGDGEQSRDFTSVEDIARGTIAALKPVGYEVVNLGGGNNPVSLNTLIKEIERHLGRKATIDYRDVFKADMVSTWADISKAKRLLDWQPQVTVFECLEQCVNWHRENRELLSDIRM